MTRLDMAKRINYLVVTLCIALCLIALIGILGVELGATHRGLKLQNTIYSDENFIFAYDNGLFTVAYDNNVLFENAHAEFTNCDQTILSTDYQSYTITTKNLSDNRGEGRQIVITSSKDYLPTLKQSFNFYQNSNYFLVECQLLGTDLSSNYIAPIVVDSGLQNVDNRWQGFLEVPFDNDAWVKFKPHTLQYDGLSHEVGAFFNPNSHEGLIIGSLTHDTWKSFISYKGCQEGENQNIKELKVYSGGTSILTRDQSAHGVVEGNQIKSSTFMVGVFEDWQNGMNSYAKLNLTITPKRASVIDSVPVGWNSWGVVQTGLDYDTAVGISDYFSKNLHSTLKTEQNTIYINLDSYWDNMSEQELKDFVAHCKQNGQEAGIYYSPFVTWFNESDIKKYTLGESGILLEDLVLKKADGTRYGNDIDGCFPLDITHPAVINHYKSTMERLIGYGFSYIKLDFLVHGALEGLHYAPEIKTGLQAYNFGMQQVSESIGDDVYINLAMSPIFPYQYANGRRIACDSYYSIDNTEYMLNGLTYGFWQAELYDDIDPDHIVLWGKDGRATSTEAVSRMISGVITGGSFLAGDNLVKNALNHQLADERIKALLTNKKLFDVLGLGKPFVGVVGDCQTESAHIYTMESGGKRYIAVFNFDRYLSAEFSIDVGTDCGSIVSLVDGIEYQAIDGVLTLTIPYRGAVLLEID